MKYRIHPARPMTALLALFTALLLSLPSQAQPPPTAEVLQPFQLTYAARYRNLEASAERALQFDEASGEWQLSSMLKLQLFGTTVTQIDESSWFRWADGLPDARRYQYNQRGIGSRSRSLEFTADGKVNYAIDDERGSLTLDGPAYDDLSSSFVLRQKLKQGETDIEFTVVDRRQTKLYRYQVVGTETLTTPVGKFDTLHVSRVRDPDSSRSTDLWLAIDEDYMLLKLVQDEPNGDTIMLELKGGTRNGEPLRGS